jgi:hypothetical protein
MLSKSSFWFGTLTCDGNCAKAWGINTRPRTQFSDDPDDYEFHADGELGDAPTNPGTYEGGEGKAPLSLNKWCARECERSTIGNKRLPDFSRRVYNKQ